MKRNYVTVTLCIFSKSGPWLVDDANFARIRSGKGDASRACINVTHQGAAPTGAEFDACDCNVDLVVDWLTITTRKRWQTNRKYKTICRRGHRPSGERLVENLCSTVIVIEISTSDLLRVGPKFTRPACRAATAAIDRYLLPAPDLCSKPADRRCCCRLMGQTDRQTDGRTDRFMTLSASTWRSG